MNKRRIWQGILALLVAAVLFFVIAPLTPLNGTVVLVLTLIFAVGGLALIVGGIIRR